MTISRLLAIGLALFSVAAAPSGKAVPAQHPLEGVRPSTKVPFPKISDWNSLHIRMERTACYGTCPVYSVEIAGDGTVTFIGERYVNATGQQTAHIAKAKVQELFKKFEKCEFFWTRDAYEASITDMPSTIVSISFDTRSKSVTDYAGERAGMPKAIAELEEAIDKAAGTQEWVIGKDKDL